MLWWYIIYEIWYDVVYGIWDMTWHDMTWYDIVSRTSSFCLLIIQNQMWLLKWSVPLKPGVCVLWTSLAYLTITARAIKSKNKTIVIYQIWYVYACLQRIKRHVLYYLRREIMLFDLGNIIIVLNINYMTPIKTPLNSHSGGCPLSLDRKSSMQLKIPSIINSRNSKPRDRIERFHIVLRTCQVSLQRSYGISDKLQNATQNLTYGLRSCALS